MGVDIQLYRARIGGFCPVGQRKRHFETSQGRPVHLLLPWIIISLLLLRSGVEQNPGPKISEPADSGDMPVVVFEPLIVGLSPKSQQRRRFPNRSTTPLHSFPAAKPIIPSTLLEDSDCGEAPLGNSFCYNTPVCLLSSQQTVRSPTLSITVKSTGAGRGTRPKRPRVSPASSPEEGRIKTAPRILLPLPDIEELIRQKLELHSVEIKSLMASQEASTLSLINAMHSEILTTQGKLEKIDDKVVENSCLVQSDTTALQNTIDILEAELAEIKKTAATPPDTSHLLHEIQNLKSEVLALTNELHSILGRQEAVENYARRECLILLGLPPKQNSHDEGEDESLLRDLMQEVGMQEALSIPLQAVHPLSRPIPGRCRPPTIVKFALRADRDELFNKFIQSKAKLLHHPLFGHTSIQPSLAKATQEKKNLLLPHFLYLKSIGKICSLREATLRVGSTSYTINNLSKQIAPIPDWLEDRSFLHFLESRPRPEMTEWKTQSQPAQISFETITQESEANQQQERGRYISLSQRPSGANTAPLGPNPLPTITPGHRPRRGGSVALFQVAPPPHDRRPSITMRQSEPRTTYQRRR